MPLRLEVFGTAGSTVNLRGQILQRTNALIAPLGESIRIDEPRGFGLSAQFEISYSVRMPVVNRPSQLVFRVDACGDADANCHTVGQQNFEVFPRDILRELQVCFKKRMLVVDENGGVELASFLKSQEIPFKLSSIRALNERPLSPKNNGLAEGDVWLDPPLILRVPPSSSEGINRGEADSMMDNLYRKGFRVIEFHEQSKTIPLVIVRKLDSGSHIDVQFPLIAALADRPRAQLFFLDVVRLAIED